MGLLDQILGSALGSRTSGQQGGPMGSLTGASGSSPLMMALMALLSSQTVGQRDGGLGGLLGGLTGGGTEGAGSGGMGGMGGLGGLMNRFQQSGHGDIMDSWMSHGENRSIAPQQLDEALGSQTMDHLSRQTGMGRDDLLSELSHVLPGVVDKMTPHGRMPNNDEMSRW